MSTDLAATPVVLLTLFLVCAVDSYPHQQAIEAVVLAWVFCDSCLIVRVVQRARVLAQHDNGTASMGTPVFQGAQLTWRPFLVTLCG